VTPFALWVLPSSVQKSSVFSLPRGLAYIFYLFCTLLGFFLRFRLRGVASLLVILQVESPFSSPFGPQDRESLYLALGCHRHLCNLKVDLIFEFWSKPALISTVFLFWVFRLSSFFGKRFSPEFLPQQSLLGNRSRPDSCRQAGSCTCKLNFLSSDTRRLQSF